MSWVWLRLFLTIGVSIHAHPLAPLSTPTPQQLLAQAVAGMAGSAPSDSTANGTVTTTAGSQTEPGNIVILTLGTNQTSEQIQTTDGYTLIYSQGQANLIVGANTKNLSLEAAASSQSVVFPLPFIIGLLNNPDESFQDLGPDTVNGAPAEHLRVSNTFGSQPDWQGVSPFTTKDIWIDLGSNLPTRISYLRYQVAGGTAGIPVDVFYSNYQSFSGTSYPTQVQESVNGTPWAVIQINTVVFNSGLTNSSFPIVQGTP